MKYFLLEFDYENIFKGYEKTHTQALVEADTFKKAVKKLVNDRRYLHPTNIDNNTIT